ncbi:MAG: TetR/AcrR family transcriptional regulator [Pseudoclavibacter sp.]
MPKIVDHDQRRADIIDGLLRIVARDGLDAATTRALAKELGVATGSLWHYFPSFDALVAAATEKVIELVSGRVERATTGLRGLARLDAIMAELLPVGEVTRTEAIVIVNFWGRLSTRSSIFEWIASSDIWWADLRVALSEAIDDGDLVSATPIDSIVDLLASITYGQQVMQAARPQTESDVHLALVRSVLAPWRTTDLSA